MDPIGKVDQVDFALVSASETLTSQVDRVDHMDQVAYAIILP